MEVLKNTHRPVARIADYQTPEADTLTPAPFSPPFFFFLFSFPHNDVTVRATSVASISRSLSLTLIPVSLSFLLTSLRPLSSWLSSALTRNSLISAGKHAHLLRLEGL